MNNKLMLPVLAIVVMLIAWMSIFGGSIFSNTNNVTIAVTGDVLLGGDVSNVLNTTNYSPFRGVNNVTSNADLLLFNFENTVTYSDNAVKGDNPLKCNPLMVHYANANNNTVVALANNHVCDYGIGGMRDTVQALDKVNITYLGVGEDENEAHAGITQNINGRKITIFNFMDSSNFTNYTYEELPYANGSAPGYSAYDNNTASKQINDAKNSGDFVIVYMHFGDEYSSSPNDNQKRIAHELIDSGANVVVGSHPHIAQGVEMYNGKPIFYSLGNFIFDSYSEDALDSYFVQIDLSGDSGECTLYPIHLANCLPYYVDSDSGNNILNSLSPQCSELEIENGVGKLKFNLTDGD